jgi:hypothetical protein
VAMMSPPVSNIPDWNTNVLTRGVHREGQHLILARHLWLEERRWQEALINHSTVLCKCTGSSGTEDGFDTDGQPDSASLRPRPRGPSQQEHRRGYQSAYGRQSSRSHHEEDGSKSLAALARTVLAAA